MTQKHSRKEPVYLPNAEEIANELAQVESIDDFFGKEGVFAKLFAQTGTIALTAFISPYAADRDRNRAINAPGDFVEVFVDCALDVCEERDPRGLYAKARAGKIPEFTGISAPYEAPAKPEVVLHTDREDAAESAARVVAYLEENGYLRAPEPVVAEVQPA